MDIKRSKSPSASLLALCILSLAMLFVVAWNPSSANFNGNQFSAPSFMINVKNGPQFTNVTSYELTVISTNAFTRVDSFLETNDFVGIIPSGHATNAAGSRVAYLSDVAGGSQTPLLQTVNGNVQGITNLALLRVNGTNAGSAITVIDGNGIAQYGTNPPLHYVTDAFTNMFIKEAGSNATTYFGTNQTANFSKDGRLTGTDPTGKPWGLVTAVNAIDYGADPSGVADSTAAIQAANDALGTVGGMLFIPRGTYKITGTIHESPSVIIQGENATYGNQGTQLSKTGSGGTIMLPFTSGTIRNLYLSGPGETNGAYGIISTNIAGIEQSTTNWKIEDVKCQGFTAGFFIHNGWVGELNTCYAQVCRDGILFSNVVDSVRVIGGEYQNCTNGIHLDGGNTYRITMECIFELNNVGLLISDDVALDSSFGITAQNCWFEGNTNSVDVTDIIQLSLINNTLTSTGTNIIFRGANRASTIIGNEIIGITALHAVGSLVRGLLWENNYDSSPNPLIDSGTQGSVYIQTNIVLSTGSFYGSAIGLTNLNYQTNAPGGSALTFNSSTFTTNLAGNITLAKFVINNKSSYESLVINVDNSSGGDVTVTMPAGVVGPVGSGTPPVFTATNNQLLKICVDHVGVARTNAWSIPFGP